MLDIAKRKTRDKDLVASNKRCTKKEPTAGKQKIRVKLHSSRMMVRFLTSPACSVILYRSMLPAAVPPGKCVAICRAGHHQFCNKGERIFSSCLFLQLQHGNSEGFPFSEEFLSSLNKDGNCELLNSFVYLGNPSPSTDTHIST